MPDPSATDRCAPASPLATPHVDTLRVLYHVVATYQVWRDTDLGLPNEFSDDAIRNGEQHLRECNWWLSDQAGDAGAHDATTEGSGKP